MYALHEKASKQYYNFYIETCNARYENGNKLEPSNEN